MTDETETLDSELAAMEAAEQEQAEIEPEKVEPEKVEPVKAVEQPKDVVPLATFLETKSELKATRHQVEELSRQIEALKPKEPAVSIDEDPVGYLEKQGKLTQEKIEALAKQMQDSNAETRVDQLRRHIDGLEKEFANKNPDYLAALEHLKASRFAQHTLIGVPEEEARKAIADELTWAVQNALKSNKNPAEVVYNLAKSMGYSKKESNGTQTLKELARAQQNNRTLAELPGETGKDELDVDSANAMNDDEFDKRFVGDDKAFERLFS